MEAGRKAQAIFRRWSVKKPVTYSRFRCLLLSECSGEIEKILKTLNVRFVRLLEPDPDVLASYAETLYEGNSAAIIELTDGTGRMFYLVSPEVQIRSESLPEPDFVLRFNVKRVDGLRALLRIIGQSKVGGKRYRYRSLVNFTLGYLGGGLIAQFLPVKSKLIQVLLPLILGLLVLFILDYPFSLLYFRGVEVLSTSTEIKEIKVARVRIFKGSSKEDGDGD
ncbi:hypothetical protein [Thermococcus gorgonarius]|uniref:Uncharacterized protein n=1 Tax=Thermococcus gorgonarius TaxID=71997 RepID=A0A2Z2M5T0_THEGO|nr:hypothetical protein [Thermococcus gorgonarius]ASJ00523.1 hypothetical protein A3K92_03040 [Thermococcus gorgonarius]